MFFVEEDQNGTSGEIPKANFGPDGIVVVRLPFFVNSSAVNTTTTLTIKFKLVTVDGNNNITEIERSVTVTYEITQDDLFS
jgi:hypothetical protein